MVSKGSARNRRIRAVGWGGVAVVGVVALVMALRESSSADYWQRLQQQLQGTGGRPADVVLVTCDTTRWDHLGCYGYGRDTTPNIDQLAALGVRFEHAYASTPITLPSHCSIFTGLTPPRHTVRNNGIYALPTGITTIPEVMKAHGRSTAAFVSAFVLDARQQLDRGFDHYDDAPGSLRETKFVVPTRRARETVDKALQWVTAQQKGNGGDHTPLFVWLHFFDPHAPYNPQLVRFGSDLTARYDSEIFEMDEALGYFRRQFERLRGAAPLYVVTTDHGEGLSQSHGDVLEPAHGVFLYQETLRIPLIFSMPGVAGGTVCRHTARQIDLLPTFRWLLGAEPDPLRQGVSLHVAPATTTPTEVYLESWLPLEDYGWAPQSALLVNGWKYIESPLPELYNLESDPGELRNLARSEPGRVQSLRNRLQLLRESTAPSKALQLDGAAQAALATLAYSGGGSRGRSFDAEVDPKTMMTRQFNVQLELDRARTLLSLRPRKGIELLREIVRRDPTNGAALVLLSWESLRQAENPKLASSSNGATDKRYFLQSATIATDLLCQHYADRPEGPYGRVLMASLEQAPDIRQRLHGMLEDHPHYLPALVWSMQLAGRARDFDRFFQDVERILAIEPTHFETRYQRAAAYQALNRREEAEQCFRELLTTHASHPQVRFSLGTLLLEKGEHEAALQHFQAITDPTLRAKLKVEEWEKKCRSGE